MTILSPPSWTSGELLSAGKINLAAANINAIKGVSMAPTASFVTATDSVTYWSRRNYRYLHFRYDFGVGGSNFRIRINGTEEYQTTTAEDVWRTFDLDAITTPPDLHAFYKIELVRPGGTTLMVYQIMESSSSSPTTWGSYSTPSAWTGSETAAQYLTKLQAISTAITSMTPVVTPPSPCALWTQSTQIYWMRRKNHSISFHYTSDTGNDISVRVNGSTIHTDTTARTTGYTVTVLYSTMTSIPAVGDFFKFEFRVNDPPATLRALGESGAPSAIFAPTFAHGPALPAFTDYNAMVTTLGEAQTILQNAGWQYACIDRPYNHPEWSFRRTARYLHYTRDGSLPAYLWKPGEPATQTSLSSTESDEFGSIDLDSVDWLLPGAYAYAYECDAVWLDDRP